MPKNILPLFFIVLGCLAIRPAFAANLCQLRSTSDALLSLPAMLVPNVEKAFDLHNIKPGQVQKLTVARCMGGRVYACFVGANLPCGKADTATNKPDIMSWCKNNPNTDFVPAYITGHDTAYIWRCSDGQPRIEAPSAGLDVSGFFREYWRRVD